MTDSKPPSLHSRRKLILLIAAAVTAAFVLLLALIINSTQSSETPSINVDSYADEVAAALDGADAGIGEKLVADTECATCHVTGEGRVAPLFDGIGSAAGDRRPPLSAEQYLYEAIVLPAAYLVEGYVNAMPGNYAERYSTADLGHMIAYLITLSET